MFINRYSGLTWLKSQLRNKKEKNSIKQKHYIYLDHTFKSHSSCVAKPGQVPSSVPPLAADLMQKLIKRLPHEPLGVRGTARPLSSKLERFDGVMSPKQRDIFVWVRESS